MLQGKHCHLCCVMIAIKLALNLLSLVEYAHIENQFVDYQHKVPKFLGPKKN